MCASLSHLFLWMDLRALWLASAVASLYPVACVTSFASATCELHDARGFLERATFFDSTHAHRARDGTLQLLRGAPRGEAQSKEARVDLQQHSAGLTDGMSLPSAYELPCSCEFRSTFAPT